MKRFSRYGPALASALILATACESSPVEPPQASDVDVVVGRVIGQLDYYAEVSLVNRGESAQQVSDCYTAQVRRQGRWVTSVGLSAPCSGTASIQVPAGGTVSFWASWPEDRVTTECATSGCTVRLLMESRNGSSSEAPLALVSNTFGI